ncbi:hypothetical protein CCH79_00018722, partial [Gambusia affinis]
MLGIHPKTTMKRFVNIKDKPVLCAPGCWQHDIMLLKLERRESQTPVLEGGSPATFRYASAAPHLNRVIKALENWSTQGGDCTAICFALSRGVLAERDWIPGANKICPQCRCGCCPSRTGYTSSSSGVISHRSTQGAEEKQLAREGGSVLPPT